MNAQEPTEASGFVHPSEVAMHLAYAEACVVLVECLMHVLAERKLVPKEELVAAVEHAIHAKNAMADANWHRRIAPVASGVLAQISNSLRALP